MRSVVTLLLLLVAVVGARAAEVQFVRVWPSWQPAESFDRISEYFTGRENTAGRTVARTQSAERAGYYFLVRLKKNAVAPAGGKFVLTLISPTDPAPKTYTFPVTADSSGMFDLGLTGTDWPNRKTHPVAWKLELLAADGHALTSAQSFLWAMPGP